MPLALVLDTNVLRQEGLVSRNMQRLARLGLSEDLDLFVPEIVAREFKTQRVAEIKANAEKARAGLLELGRQIDANGTTHRGLSEVRTRVSDLEKAAEAEVETDFSAWLSASGAKLIGVDASVTAGVLDVYFSGTGAFRKIKAREDFPDAFVSAGVRSLLAAYDRVYVAVKDGSLKKHLEVEPRYTVLDGVPDFLQLAPVVEILLSFDKKEKDTEAFKAMLGSEPVRARLTTYLKGATELLEEVYVEEESIDGLDVLGVRLYGASLNYAQAASISAVDYSAVEFLQPGHYYVEVVIHTRARIDYGADFGEFQDLPTDRVIEHVSMDGDGTCDLQEVRTVVLHGYLEIAFDSKLSPDAVEVHTNYLSAADAGVSVGLEVNAALVT